MGSCSSVFRHLAVILGLMVTTSAVVAQTKTDPASSLEDFVHYALVANPDMAEAYAQDLLETTTPPQLAELVDEQPQLRDRLARAIEWARRVPELEATVSALAQHLESGRLELARDSARIDGAVEMLAGTRRDQLIARNRLIAAGEYAVPSLVKEISDPQTSERSRWNAERVLEEIGREAVAPLVVAVPRIAAVDQRRIIDRLEAINYPHAAPALAELAEDADAPATVREAARNALDRMGIASEASPGELYSELARMYFDEREDLIATPHQAVNNIWTWDDHSGLIAQPVDQNLYAPIMAMRTAQRALDYLPSDESAMAIYAAANLRRENRLGGRPGPFFDSSDYSPQFYATVYGPGLGQDVLVLGLDSRDTLLVRDALGSLAATSGQGNLFGRYGGTREPLIEAMQYPDRRVQLESALILARALPDQAFPASPRVLPLLTSTVGSANQERAIIVAENADDRRSARDQLGAMGFTVIGDASSVERLAEIIRDAPGIDLVYADAGSPTAAGRVVDALRARPGTLTSPVILEASATDLPAYRTAFGNDRLLSVVGQGISADALRSNVEDLMRSASGGRLTADENDQYAIDALYALKDIALTRPGAYDMRDAEPTLIDALQSGSESTRLLVAEILANIDSPDAQRALLRAALSSSAGDDRIPLLDYAAMSVRRFGDAASDAQVSELALMIKQATGDEADAAARLMGALNRRAMMEMSRTSTEEGS